MTVSKWLIGRVINKIKIALDWPQGWSNPETSWEKTAFWRASSYWSNITNLTNLRPMGTHAFESSLSSPNRTAMASGSCHLQKYTSERTSPTSFTPLLWGTIWQRKNLKLTSPFITFTNTVLSGRPETILKNSRYSCKVSRWFCLLFNSTQLRPQWDQTMIKTLSMVSKLNLVISVWCSLDRRPSSSRVTVLLETCFDFKIAS